MTTRLASIWPRRTDSGLPVLILSKSIGKLQTAVKCNTNRLTASKEFSIKTSITVRIEAELLTELRQLAREENRSLTNFIETVLRQRLAGAVSGSSAIPKAPPARSAKEAKDKPTHAA